MSRAPRIAFMIGGGAISGTLAFIWLVSSLFWAQIPVRAGSHVYCIDFSIGCIGISDYAIWNPASPSPLSEPRATFYVGPILGGNIGWKALPAFEYTGPATTAPPPGSRLNIRWQLIFPLYPFFLALGIPSALMLRTEWKARRHARVGKCRKCGYDLAGITELCPECGKSATRSIP